MTAAATDHATDQDTQAGSTSWSPVELAEILAGGYSPPRPSMLQRADGACLIYPGRSHSISAEPEALKTFLALTACAERIEADETVVYMDFEATAPEIVGRLLALGVKPEVIAAHFIYMRPDEPLAGGAVAELDTILSRKPSLVVIDGLTEALTIQGLSPLDNTEVAQWLELLPRRITRTGAACVTLDHVVKDKEARGRYALGAQHKLAGVDVAYTLEVVEPFGHGREGVSTLKVQKDRPGGVRAFAQDGAAATIRATSLTGGRVSITVEVPEAAERSKTFRPTEIMRRISDALQASPGGLSKRAIRATVAAKAQYIDLGLELLIAEGHVRVERSGTANLHQLAAPYTPDRAPVLQPCSDRVPTERSTPGSDRVPVFPPLKGETRTRNTELPTPNNHDRVPDYDPDLQARAEAIWARHHAKATA